MCMGAAIHESGGGANGHLAGKPVLNGWNQSWDVPNLLVTDASAFAGGGTAGTTLTVMALTFALPEARGAVPRIRRRLQTR